MTLVVAKTMMMNPKWKAGDWAVYRKSKRSTTPGPRATSVKACRKGENYTYIVDKFWIVDSTLPGGRLMLRTARGKTHIIDANDPNLRKPGWLRRLLWRGRLWYSHMTNIISPAAMINPALTSTCGRMPVFSCTQVTKKQCNK